MMGVREQQGDFLVAALAMMSAGIFLGSKADVPIWEAAVCFFVLFALAAVLAWRNHGKTWAVLLVLCFAAGFLRFTAANTLPQDDISRYAGKTAVVEGILMEEPHVTETAEGAVKVRYAVEVRRIKEEGQEKSACGGMYVHARWKEMSQVPEAGIGDAIRAAGVIRLPHGYGNPGQIDTVMLLRSQGITARLAAGKQGVAVEPGEDRMFLRYMAGIRKAYRENMESVMPKADAAAIFAMLFGGYEGMKPELVEAFTITGIVHILSVSGSHVSLIAATMAWLGMLLRLPKLAQSVLVVAAIAVYCVLAGCVPPVIRSGIMGGLAFLAIALERENDARRILLLTGLGMLLAWPLLLFHISFQLSFAATAGLLFVAPPLHRWMRARRFPEFLAGSLSITIAAQAFTLPFLAWYFHQLSLSSLLSNLVVVPIVEGMIVLGLFAGMAAWILPLLGKVLFLADSLLLGLVYELTRWMAYLPGSQVYVPSMEPWMGALFYGVLLYAIQAGERRERIRAWMVLHRGKLLPAILAGAVFFVGWQWSRPSEVMVAFIDVGQGDAMMVRTPHGHGLMFDTGGTRDGDFDVGSRVDVPYLLHYGVTKLDYVFLSHAHEDHAAGAGGILRHMPVGAVIIASEGREEYRKSMKLSPAEMSRTTFAEAREGEVFDVDGVRVEVLYAPVAEKKGTGNEVSNVYRVAYGNAAFLVTGDLVKEEEAKLLKKHPDLRCTVLKCGHHGSRTSTSDEFLKAASPKWAVFCVGKDNTFGHPHKETVEKVEKAGIEICRTDEDGAIAFYTDGKRMRVEKYRE